MGELEGSGKTVSNASHAAADTTFSLADAFLYPTEGSHEAQDELVERLYCHYHRVVKDMWRLGDEILNEYCDGWVSSSEENGVAEKTAYPDDWLKSVGFEDGPTPIPK